MTHKSFVGTLFENCLSTKGTEILIYNWLNDVKNGADSAAVKEVRNLFNSGNTELATQKKRMLRAIVPTGFMPEGRTENSPIKLNGVCMVDIDIHNPEWSLAAMKKFESYPGIIGMYRTIRGGLRIFILMPQGTNRENFRFIENVILSEIDRLLNCKHDEQATTISHLCSTSYDPEAFISDPEKLQEFPYEEVLCRIQREVYRQIDAETSDTKASAADHEPTVEEEINQTFDELMGKPHEAYTKTQLDNHFNRFVGRCPLDKGARNQNLLRLGQYAHFMRYSTSELEHLIKMAVHLIDDPEYNAKRVRECVCWGYRHNDKQVNLSRIAKQDFQGESFHGDPSLAHLAQKAHSVGCCRKEDSQQSDFEDNFRKIIDESCPYIPVTVYEKLPEFFGKLLSHSPNRRDTDLSGLAALITAGAAMPNLLVQCREKNYSPNIFFTCIGPAASGKSAATKAPRLLKYIDEELKSGNEEAYELYERQQVRWQLEIKNSLKDGRDPNWEIKPKGEPICKKIVGEAQTSRSKLITDLACNPDGLYVFSEEVNVLNEAVKSQTGHHNAELAKIAMNEPVGISYKNGRTDIRCEFPKLTLFGTGTPNQYVDLIGNLHEGMESRVITMLTSSIDDWMSWGDADEDSLKTIDEAYDEAAKYLLRVYRYLKQSPTHVTIPASLRYQCDAYCKYCFQRLKEEGYSNLSSIIKRAPILIARICGILCGLRKYEMALNCYEMEAAEEDVEIALKITMTLMQHTFVATTMLIDNSKKVNTPHVVFRQELLLKSLPEEFTISEITQKCICDYNYSVASVKRMVKRWIEDEYIVRARRGIYVKTDKKIFTFKHK